MSGYYDCSVRRLAYTPAWVPLKYPVTYPERSCQPCHETVSGQPTECRIETVEIAGCPDHPSEAVKMGEASPMECPTATPASTPSIYRWPPVLPITTSQTLPARVVVKQPVLRVDSHGKGLMFDLFC